MTYSSFLQIIFISDLYNEVWNGGDAQYNKFEYCRESKVDEYAS